MLTHGTIHCWTFCSIQPWYEELSLLSRNYSQTCHSGCFDSTASCPKWAAPSQPGIFSIILSSFGDHLSNATDGYMRVLLLGSAVVGVVSLLACEITWPHESTIVPVRSVGDDYGIEWI